MKQRYTYQDNFEMLIVRHDYLKRVEDVDSRWLKDYEPIVKTTASIMFQKLKPNFAKVGYDLDDIEAITNCYMISYMSLYSLERNEAALERINNTYTRRFGRPATEAEISRKEKINMMSFLRQRLQHASVICARKARNITVDHDRRATYAFTAIAVPASEEAIYKDGADLGYRKVAKAELKEIKKAAKANRSKELYDENGYGVLEIELLSDGITEGDYKSLFIDENTDIYHVSAERSLSLVEEDVDMALMIEEFFEMTKKEKRSCLKDFIDLYRNDKKYGIELSAARKMLKTL